MQKIKIKTPAKINLTLEILNRRKDGFHNIDSIMQTISLYDYLTITIKDSKENKILLSGTSDKIPYNENNLAYKAAKLFLNNCDIKNREINIHIEKNIPVAAGLAGGSSNAAGVLYGLNKLFSNLLQDKKLHELAAQLGSDLNFCLLGGCVRCTSRGENLKSISMHDLQVSLIKPENLAISAKFAYQKFDLLKNHQYSNYSERMENLLEKNKFDTNFLYNDLEKALVPEFKVLQYIKEEIPNSIMSGSGSTFFCINDEISKNFDNSDFEIFNNLNTVRDGVKEI